MTVLERLDWGDVVRDGDGILVCEARLDDDAVLVKRWAGSELDAELTARLALRQQGVVGVELLGHGPGWMVLEELGETMWRPGGGDDLADPDVLRGLARWFAACHDTTPEGLPPAPLAALAGEDLVALAADALPASLLSRLHRELPRWQALVQATGPVLAVGAFAVGSFAVLGGGIQAMGTELALCHAGSRAADLVLLQPLLDDASWRFFCDEYRRAAGAAAPDDQALAAAGAVELALRVLLGALAGGPVDATLVAELEARWPA